MKRIFFALYGALIAFAVLVAFTVQAQTAPTVQLTCAPTAAISPASVTLTWSSTGAASCTASGSWTGTKTTSGTQTLADLRANAAYSLTCSAAPTLGSARLSWTAPTQNTDGTPLANLAGYRIVYGTSASALTQTVQIANPSAASYTITNLANGTWYFGTKAYTATSAESVVSNVVSKAVASTPGASATGQCAIVIDTRPNPPTNLQVIEPTAYEIEIDWSKPQLVAGRVRGSVALGTECIAAYGVPGEYYGVSPDAVSWSSWWTRTLYPVAKCAPSQEQRM